MRVTAGLDLLGLRFDGGYEGIPPTTGEGDSPMTLSDQGRVAIDVSTWELLPGAYLEAGLRPFPELLVTPGIHADYSDFIRRGAVDPRLSARLEATETTAIKAGLGRFSQIPSEPESASPIGNPNLPMAHAIHASAGVEQKVTDSFSASVEGFAKWMEQIPAATPDGQAPYFVATQDGRVFGGELLLRVRPKGRVPASRRRSRATACTACKGASGSRRRRAP